MLLQVFSVVTIAVRSPPTVYAFLNPKFPSATWDFFCLGFGRRPGSIVGKRRTHAAIMLGLIQQLVDLLDEFQRFATRCDQPRADTQAQR